MFEQVDLHNIATVTKQKCVKFTVVISVAEFLKIINIL